ncbi:hypothetical protein [Haloarchaeobius baliensis]|uniref:hypothetical protein n=1 Tax=Haloarchaeobius baliensis TaxID=1670458 RepID=UPI003F882684
MKEDVVKGEDGGLVPMKIRRSLNRSQIGTTIARISAGFLDSRLVGASERVVTTVRESSTYKWLTKEPEPVGVVVDLRDSYTVGTLTRLGDVAVERIEPYWQTSRVRSGVGTVNRGVRKVAETEGGRWLVRTLRPPVTPEETSGEPGAGESG